MERYVLHVNDGSPCLNSQRTRHTGFLKGEDIVGVKNVIVNAGKKSRGRKGLKDVCIFCVLMPIYYGMKK